MLVANIKPGRGDSSTDPVFCYPRNSEKVYGNCPQEATFFPMPALVFGRIRD
jgi:hypothetical protein